MSEAEVEVFEGWHASVGFDGGVLAAQVGCVVTIAASQAQLHGHLPCRASLAQGLAL